MAVLMLRENEMIHERRGFYMDKIVDFKTTCNDLDVEFEVMPLVNINDIENERQRRIVEGSAEIDEIKLPS